MARIVDDIYGKANVQLRPGHVSLILFLAVLVVIAVALLFTVRVESVAGTEVGVMINNITGDVEIISNPGTVIFNGLYKTFHKIDKREQKLEMAGADQVRIKTSDGSDVQLDLTVQYKIDLTNVVAITDDSGVLGGLPVPGDVYKEKWARDYARSLCRTIFGELTTEEFYDRPKLTEKADKSRRELNARLEKHGLIITSVIPGAFQFYKEYESKINEKKLADQEVEEQKSKANAATQAQEHQRVEATKKKEVAIAEFAGSMKELIVQADADAEKVMKEADAYAIEKQIGADAEYYQREKNAQAILATAKTEAEGLRKMAEALTGEGGVNIVKMEYARRLQTMTITGQPFVREGLTERFEHTQYPAAASPRRATTPGKGQ